jgi:hypothetical protein
MQPPTNIAFRVAREAIGRAIKLEGFRDVPDGFVIERHVVDEDNQRLDYGFLSR